MRWGLKTRFCVLKKSNLDRKFINIIIRDDKNHNVKQNQKNLIYLI